MSFAKLHGIDKIYFVSPCQSCFFHGMTGGVMSFSADHMTETIRRLGELPNRSSFRVIVGGSCVNEKTALDIGADGFTRDAYNVPKLCTKLMRER